MIQKPILGGNSYEAFSKNILRLYLFLIANLRLFTFLILKSYGYKFCSLRLTNYSATTDFPLLCVEYISMSFFLSMLKC